MLAFIKKFFVVLLVITFVMPLSLFASETNGTIDNTNKYAKFLNANFGTLNFKTSYSNVAITDTEITGYVWGDIAGWINLDPTFGGITNDAEGNLSGYAWGEKTGWINFDPTNGGVTIGTNGEFSGYAWSQNMGWIIFNCGTNSSCGSGDFKVATDWRPASVRVEEEEEEGGGGGGSSGDNTNNNGNNNPPPPPPPPPPVENPPTEPILPPPPVEPTTPPVIPITPGNPPPPSPGIVQNIVGGISGQIKESSQILVSIVDNTSVQVKKIINDPVGSVVTKTITTVGVVGSGIAAGSVLFLNPLSITEIFLIPLRLWALVLSFLGLKKKYRPWGTVYDSITKQPLDPAYVVLQDLSGKEINTSITDIDGRYGFLVTPGQYRIVANKTNYRFPSTRLAGKTSDILYANLYFGEELTVTPEDMGVITKNIPLDPEKFDWNEYAKKNMNVMKFYSSFDRLLNKISNYFFFIGFFIALVAFYVAPAPYNSIIFGLYVLLVILRFLGLKPKVNGNLVDKISGVPLSFAVIKVFGAESGREIMQKVADAYGRYYILVPKGRYFIKIEKKNQDESYTPVFTSPVIDAKGGIINQKFFI